MGKPLQNPVMAAKIIAPANLIMNGNKGGLES
jgi:hypothetical protein